MITEHRFFKFVRIAFFMYILFSFLGTTLFTYSVARAEPAVSTSSRLPGSSRISSLQQSEPGTADLTFLQLGGESMILRPRYSQRSLVFELPYRWQIIPRSASINLDFDVISDVLNANNPLEVDPGVLEVYVDGEIAGSLIPPVGLGHTANIEIPPSVFADPQENQHVITLTYTSRVRCTVDDVDPARIMVRDTSSIHFDYRMQPIVRDMAEFPRPLYQSLLEPEFVLIVIPDAVEVHDLEAATAVAATIGSVTFGDMEVLLRRASEVTPGLLASMSSIIIGTPSENSLIADLYDRGMLPSTLNNNGQIRISATGQTANPEDGVIQEIFSEYNPEHITLILTGTTSEAVMRSTRALSSLDPRFGLSGSAVVVSDVSGYVPPIPPASTTLNELGLRRETLEEFGVRVSQVHFYVGSNWVFEQNARLNLEYRHSAALNSGASNLNVLLNGELVASVQMIDANTTTGVALIELPSSDLQPGRNQLIFEANLEMEDPCAETSSDSAWMRVLGSSTLDLEYQKGTIKVLESLRDPLEPFFSKFDLSDVRFVLSQSPSLKELEGAIKLARIMGESTNGRGFTPRVSLGNLPEEDMEAYHLIVIGRPSTNDVLGQINPYLYQPFVDGEDSLQQVIGNITYRLPEHFSLGVIQLIRSPWNENRAITVLSGTTEEGLAWAIDSIVAEEPYTNLTFVGDGRIENLNGEDMLRGSIAAIESVTDQKLDVNDPQLASVADQPSTPFQSENGGITPTDYSIGTGLSSSVTLISFGLIGAGALIVAAAFLLKRSRR